MYGLQRVAAAGGGGGATCTGETKVFAAFGSGQLGHSARSKKLGEIGASLRNSEVAVVAASVLLSAAAGKQQGAAAALGDGAVACEPS